MWRFLDRIPTWVFVAICVAGPVVLAVVQNVRYRRASEPFSRVGAWVYSGADDMGIPFFGPEGVKTVFFNDKEFGDDELAGLKENLEQFPALQSVRLENTKITDVGLKLLSGLRLSHIGLSGTQVTAAGVDEFKRQVPECTVYWQPPKDDQQESEDADPSCD